MRRSFLATLALGLPMASIILLFLAPWAAWLSALFGWAFLNIWAGEKIGEWKDRATVFRWDFLRKGVCVEADHAKRQVCDRCVDMERARFAYLYPNEPIPARLLGKVWGDNDRSPR